MSVRKAVFPVAGAGTRFLAATKAMRKELLPIHERPKIGYLEALVDCAVDQPEFCARFESMLWDRTFSRQMDEESAAGFVNRDEFGRRASHDKYLPAGRTRQAGV